MKKPSPEQQMEAYKTIEIGGRFANVKALLEPKNLFVIAIGITIEIALIVMFVGH